MQEEQAKRQKEEEEEATVKTTWPFVGKIFSVKREEIALSEKRVRIRDSVIHQGAVVLLPLLSENELILVKQYRSPTGKILLELPAGLLETGEDPKERAQKELREETGYSASELTPIGGMFSAPGFCSEYLHFFLAKNLTPSPMPPDDDEAIDRVPIHLSEALKFIDDGTICDAKTIAGIFKYVRLLNR